MSNSKTLHNFKIIIDTKDVSNNIFNKIKSFICTEKIRQTFAKLWKKFKDYMFKCALEDIMLVEPTYDLTKEEYDELMYKIDHMEEIIAEREKKRKKWFR